MTSTLPGESTHTHTPSSKLEDQATTAALYVTGNSRSANYRGCNSANRQQHMNNDKTLSSAGVAASHKLADSRDLSCYPSAGLKKNTSTAGAAASLGWAKQKPVEYRKPNHSSSASTAAMLAKNYKMDPVWQPQQSTAGAKAAVLANKCGGTVEIWRPETNSWGNSAANEAFRKDRTKRLSPKFDYGHNAKRRQGSLLAATGAMSDNSKRSDSVPAPVSQEIYPDKANASKNALCAATSAVKPTRRRGERYPEGGSVSITSLPRDMFTSHPPVTVEVEEKNRSDILHASAVAMAQSMYRLQQKQIDQENAHSAAPTAVHRRRSSLSSASEGAVPMHFSNLQEAARKLAQERLAKLYGDNEKNREFWDYYGSYRPTSRLSIRGRPRHRALSDPSLSKDKAQSEIIRAQMSMFSNKLSEVDQRKRQQDRENLIAVAQRNVTKSLHGMDERVFSNTRKVAPSLLNEWEVKAHAAAQAKIESRKQNHGNVNIGGGKFIARSEIDLIAARNIQPVLDEIYKKAEQEKIRRAESKLEHENQQRKAAEKKAHEKEVKEINKKLRQQDKDEQKTKEDGKKSDRKVRDQEERATMAEEKRLAKTKAKSKAVSAVHKGAVHKAETGPAAVAHKATVENKDSLTAEPLEGATIRSLSRISMQTQSNARLSEVTDALNKSGPTPLSPSSPRDGSKVKNWLKTRFTNRISRGYKSPKTEDGNEKAFIGGVVLTRATVQNARSPSPVRSSSVHDVSLAGKEAEPRISLEKDDHGANIDRDSLVSDILSTERDDNEFEEARDKFDDCVAPPPTLPTGPVNSNSPMRDSKFHEGF